MNAKKFLSHSSAIEFNAESLAILRGPGVYMYVREDKAIYIGASRSAIGRCLARNHHKKQHLLAGTSLLIFPCKDHTAAKELEDWLIFDLKPIGNKRGGWQQLANALGMTRSGTTQTYSPL